MKLIGVDYGIGKDIPMYSVLKQTEDSWELIETGKIEDFDYSKYVGSKHQIIGENKDLEKFQKFLNNPIK